MTDITADDSQPTPAAPAPGRVHPWTDTTPHPWRRYFARCLDCVIFGLIGIMILAGVVYFISPEAGEAFSALVSSPLLGTYLLSPVLMVSLAAPSMALSIGLSGGTPGKWLFGVRVAGQDGRPIGVRAAFVRELKAATIGMGLGVPLLSFLLIWQAKEILEDQKTTSWDEDGEHVVTHRAMNAWQIILMIIGGGAWAAMRLLGALSQIGVLDS